MVRFVPIVKAMCDEKMKGWLREMEVKSGLDRINMKRR